MLRIGKRSHATGAIPVAHFWCSFREVMEVFVVKKTPKAHIQMVHVPQFIAYTNLSLGFTNKQVVEAEHTFYDALCHRYRTSSVTPSTYPQHLLQSVRH